MLKSGATAPAFALRSLEGELVTLEELRKQGPVAVVFFKSSCPVCQYSLPFVQRLQGANVIAVSQDDTETAREFAEAYGLSFPVLLDERRLGYPASNSYGLTHVPTFFVVEPDSSISHAWTGFSRPDLEELGRRFGMPIVREDEKTPIFRPG